MIPSIRPLDSKDYRLDGTLKNCDLSKNASLFLDKQELPSFFKLISEMDTNKQQSNIGIFKKEDSVFRNMFKDNSIN